MQPGLGERLDQLDLVGGADRAGFDLESLERTFFVDLHMCRHMLMIVLLNETGMYPADRTATRCRRRDRPFPMAMHRVPAA